MYKIFIVEDEIVVREGIRDNIDWESTDFIMAGEAPDGEMALPLIQEIKPDILITDIKMPFMDGLELCRIVRKSMPWIKIVIISGHDEFNYAKEAISIGVTEYMLKPVSSVELLKQLNKVAIKIENEKEEKANIEKIKNQLNSNRESIKEKFLNEVSLGIITTKEALEKASYFNIDLVSRYYLVEIIEIEKSENIKYFNQEELLEIDIIISNYIEKNPEIIRFKRNLEEFVLIIKGESEKDLEEISYRTAQSIKYEVERTTECILSIGIGSVQERVHGIAYSFKDASTANRQKILLGKGKIIDINDIKIDKEESRLLDISKISITDFLKVGSKQSINGFLDEYIKCLNTTGLKSIMYIHYAFLNIVLNTVKFIENLEGDNKKVIEEISNSENTLLGIVSINQFKEQAFNILSKAFDYRDNIVESKYLNVIAMAKKYINENYSDSSMSLNSVAAFVNISPSHFSTIFSQETGETFIEYLTKTRINKAMELLKTTSQKTFEISYAVGYNDPHYFSHLFKKVTGRTPREFRINE